MNEELITTARVEMEREGAGMLIQVKSLEIVDDTTYTLGCEWRKEARSFSRKVENFFKPLKQAADQAKKALLDAEKKAKAPAEEVLALLDYRLGAYYAEQERKRKEEEDRIAAELRLAEEERLLNEAAALEDAGRADEALDLIQDAPAPIIVLPRATPKVEGVSVREQWHAEVVDIKALVRFVAEHPEWIHLLEPDMPRLNELARAQKGALSIPGVKAVSDRVIISR